MNITRWTIPEVFTLDLGYLPVFHSNKCKVLHIRPFLHHNTKSNHFKLTGCCCGGPSIWRHHQPSYQMNVALTSAVASEKTQLFYLKSHSRSNKVDGPSSSNHDHDPPTSLLLKPYDMTKKRSTGTSFTEKTQKISNTINTTPMMTSNVAPLTAYSTPSTMRAEMTRKYNTW